MARRWELTPEPLSRWEVATAAVCAAVWGPVEAVLGWLTTVAVLTPFGVTPGIDGFPDGWPAVPIATGLGAATALSTLAGVGLVHWVASWSGTDVVVPHDRGIRTERLRRNGKRTTTDLDWDRLHGDALERDGILQVGLVVARLSPRGTATQHREIADCVTARFAARPADGPPLVKGWAAWYDDRGASLEESRGGNRLGEAALFAVGAVVCGANTAAFVTATFHSDPRWFFLAIGAGWASLVLLVAGVDLAVFTSRWIARPGAVVLERRGPGRGFAFEARSLEEVTLDHEDSGYGYRLVARAGADGTGDSRDVLERYEDRTPFAAGAWLARHAEIPVHRRTEFVPKPPQ